jgi:hypothetical protein
MQIRNKQLPAFVFLFASKCGLLTMSIYSCMAVILWHKKRSLISTILKMFILHTLLLQKFLLQYLICHLSVKNEVDRKSKQGGMWYFWFVCHAKQCEISSYDVWKFIVRIHFNKYYGFINIMPDLDKDRAL